VKESKKEIKQQHGTIEAEQKEWKGKDFFYLEF
jgi:hypothetical protein